MKPQRGGSGSLPAHPPPVPDSGFHPLVPATPLAAPGSGPCVRHELQIALPPSLLSLSLAVVGPAGCFVLGGSGLPAAPGLSSTRTSWKSLPVPFRISAESQREDGDGCAQAGPGTTGSAEAFISQNRSSRCSAEQARGHQPSRAAGELTWAKHLQQHHARLPLEAPLTQEGFAGSTDPQGAPEKTFNSQGTEFNGQEVPRPPAVTGTRSV